MIWNKIQHLAHAVRLQLRHPSVIIRARTNRRIQFIMVGNVVPVQTLRAGLKIGRGVNIAYAHSVQIRHDLMRLGKREPPIKLESVRAGRNARVLAHHSAISSHSERSRGIPVRNLTVTPRDPSTPARCARDDRV